MKLFTNDSIDQLKKWSVYITTFYICLRPLGVGLDLSEPEGGFLYSLALVSAVLSISFSLLSGSSILPRKSFTIPLVVFSLLTLCSIFTASSSGYLQPALDLGHVWFSDLLIFIAVYISAKDSNVCKLYVSCLVSALVVVGLYTLYQKLYSIEYLQKISLSSDSFQGVMEKGSASHKQGFLIRLGSTRPSGPFAYANALAAYSLLLVPLGLYLSEHKICKSLLIKICALCGLIALTLSGSKAGIAIGICVEFFVFAYIFSHISGHFIKGVLSTIATVGLSLAIIFGLCFFFWVNLSPTISQIALPIMLLSQITLLFKNKELIARSKICMSLGLLATLAFATLCVLLFSTSSPTFLLQVKEQLTKHLTVRINYWLAAIEAIKVNPFTGWGLDNFGELYPQFKQATGWEVRRVHNHILQLAVDGGILYPISFIWLVGALLFTTNKTPTVADTHCTSATNIPYLKVGKYASIGAFFLTYLLSFSGVFNGLGFEFITLELFNDTESMRATQHTLVPLLIHISVNLILIPVFFLMTICATWKELENVDLNKVCVFLKVGVAAVVLHSLFDFTPYHAVISSTLCIAAGIILACKRCSNSSKASQSKPILAVMVIIIGVLFFFLVVHPVFKGGKQKNTATKASIGIVANEDLESTLQVNADALSYRPNDAELHISRAFLLLQAAYSNSELGYTPNDAREELEIAVKLSPENAANRMTLGEFLNTTYPQEKDKIDNLFYTGISKYPLKAAYHLLYAKFLWRTGNKTKAKTEAALAVNLHNQTTDSRVKLDDRQIMDAYRIINGVTH